MAAPARRLAVLAAALAALSALPWAAASAPLGPAACRAGPARTETLAELGPRGELRFAAGGRAILDSLRWPEDAAGAAAQERLGAFRGRRIRVVPRGAPDRWERERVDAQTEDAQAEDGDADLAGDLIAAGLAYADPGEADALCRPGLRAVEAGARARRLGLWERAPPSVEDGPALRALAGRFAVVEGRVRHVGERSARTYLDFAPRGADGLTVTVTKRTWRMMAARGLSADTLEGRRVRVRGLVELWRGPTIEAATAEAVELVDEAPGAAPSESPAPGASGRELGLRR
ncbi:pentapeptide repeat-containing protein [Methylobacterium sp. NEAU 140]|uniref:thermonuclease family protein n=1 Tax=Methylobacterium sp. NEAU 140 TaxID=3064945 RepID=UPI00273759F8|nr:pentapeptide repeat-containing protein [Methylobacterium sp. NEAU 140]MDP4021584.1 pentapeptide repeat-containing protein [Methylobacterium sp. NEAU 140]